MGAQVQITLKEDYDDENGSTLIINKKTDDVLDLTFVMDAFKEALLGAGFTYVKELSAVCKDKTVWTTS